MKWVWATKAANPGKGRRELVNIDALVRIWADPAPDIWADPGPDPATVVMFGGGLTVAYLEPLEHFHDRRKETRG